MSNIVEWFDPHNKSHLKAYRRLEETGQWPSGVIPNDITFSTNWQIALAAKMANAWIRYKIDPPVSVQIGQTSDLKVEMEARVLAKAECLICHTPLKDCKVFWIDGACPLHGTPDIKE